MIAGYAGGLYCCFMGYVGPTFMYWVMSGHAIMMVIIGGLGTLVGPIIGAGVFTLIQDIFSYYTEHWMLIVGIIFAVFVVFVPKGIMGIFSKE
jgi:branched-chain amino acid transport system permease protein